ncbi:hypothetical protein LWI28_021425 [Acer negundo]|uniref:Uncharacterized protein n=1 Tax=Acer negundo TaxID=4023 RepID=A0AAD5I7K4_ACENE|nr:hypothetical protein LWI28_021425 [Acer negundo]
MSIWCNEEDEDGDGVLRPPLLTPSMLGGREVLGVSNTKYEVPGTKYGVQGTEYRIPGYRCGVTSGYCVSGNQDDPDPSLVMMLHIASF